MLLRIVSIIFGVLFIFAGVAGFLPSFMSNGLLLGVFEVDTVHNLVHLVSGVLAIMAATSFRTAKLYFQVFGIIYGLVTIAGFLTGGDLHILMMHMNMADNFLHLVIAVIALYLGFSSRESR